MTESLKNLLKRSSFITDAVRAVRGGADDIKKLHGL